VLAGVGSVYVGTRSVLITIIAAAVAIVLAVLVLEISGCRATAGRGDHRPRPAGAVRA
jgi:hypothetical protein